MPRPRKTNDAQQCRHVIFRLTQTEYDQLEALATRAGMRVNALAKRLTRQANRRIVIQLTRRHDPAFIAQLKAIGNNLNQLTFRSHLTGEISPNVEKLCDEIRRMVMSAIQEDEAA